MDTPDLSPETWFKYKRMEFLQGYARAATCGEKIDALVGACDGRYVCFADVILYHNAVVEAAAKVARDQAECWNDMDSGRVASAIIEQAILVLRVKEGR